MIAIEHAEAFGAPLNSGVMCPTSVQRFCLTVTLLGLITGACVNPKHARVSNISGCLELAEDGEGRDAAGLMHSYQIEPEWLQERISIDEAQEYVYNRWYGEDSGYVAGHQDAVVDDLYQQFGVEPLQRIANRMEDGDTIWIYRTPDIYWKSLAGQEGIIVLRDCAVVGGIVVEQS